MDKKDNNRYPKGKPAIGVSDFKKLREENRIILKCCGK
jgi:hypothetical protein